MNMYSRELAISGRSTVLYMIDEMQGTVDRPQNTMNETQEQHEQTLARKDQKISAPKAQLAVCDGR